ncbi:MAG: radical SAM family heme chaperone HemW [Myxococcota bacterium]
MNSPFGVYVHVPFCARACPYCDFDFRVDPRPNGVALLEALRVEVGHREDARRAEPAHTLYVGGGTPSVLSAPDLAALLQWMAATWSTASLAEWTVEFNPEHADPARLDALVEAGVTRISMGTQSFDPGGLVQLGRAHRPAAAAEAVARAHARGLAVSVDLIVGWPGQTQVGLDAEIDAVLALGCTHVSIYALTIEPGTPWERLVERGVRAEPRADATASLLAHTHARLTSAGFEHYEVASYAKEGTRAEHNSGYWLGRDYVGVGPSAASARFDGPGVRRRTNARGADWWSGQAPTEETLDEEAGAREAVWLALRLLEGVSVSALLKRVRRDRDWLNSRLVRSLAVGNVELDGDRLRVAPGRWLHHDAIAVDVL